MSREPRRLAIDRALANVGATVRWPHEPTQGVIRAVVLGKGGWPQYVIEWHSAPGDWSSRISAASSLMIVKEPARIRGPRMTAARFDRRPADRRLKALAYLIDNLAYKVPEAIDTLQTRTAHLDGYPTNNGNPTVTNTSSTTSVEAAAIITDETRRTIAQIYDDITTFATIAHDHARMLDRIIGTRDRTPIEPKLCDCRGRDGALLLWTPGGSLADGNGWSDPTCRNIASRGPLCDTCSKREYRWRDHNGLPPRIDGVYAGDLTYQD